MSLSRENIAKGLALLGDWAGVQVTEAQRRVWSAGCGDLTAEQWERGVTGVIRSERSYGRLPDPSTLRSYALAVGISAEASRAFDAVIAARSYHPESGASWTYRGVLEKCGRAAAEAFQACGVSSFAFISDKDRPFLLKRFEEAYKAAVMEEPGTRLLASGEQRALESGDA